LHLLDRLLERAERVRVGGLVEAHMAVADLQEGEAGGLRHGLADKAERGRHAARHRPQDAGSGPGHAFQHLATADAVAVVRTIVILRAHESPPWGWSPRACLEDRAVYSRPFDLPGCRRNSRALCMGTTASPPLTIDPMKFLEQA